MCSKEEPDSGNVHLIELMYCTFFVHGGDAGLGKCTLEWDILTVVSNVSYYRLRVV